MKKILLKGGVLSILLTVLLVSCKKEVIPKQEALDESKKQEMTSDGRMLIFNSSSTYESLVSNPDENVQKELLLKISKMNHTTYAEKIEKEKSVDLIDDEYFSSIINEDAIVQIGDYLYRINAASEKVFVLPASHISEYADLVNENKANKNIRQFSTSDDVIELSEGGDAGEKGLFCSDNQASNPSWEVESWSSYQPYTITVPNSNESYVRRYKRTCKMNYLKLGIYFNLQAKLEVVGVVTISASSTGTYGTDYFQTLDAVTHIRSYRKYKIRCGDEHGWYYQFSALTNGHDMYKTEYNSYQGSKGISKYWLKCAFSYCPNLTGPEVYVFPDNLPNETQFQREIKSGY